jgi:hypothetical protein
MILWLKRLGSFFSDKYVNKEFKGKEVDINKITVYSFLSGEEWFPTAELAQMGVKPLIYGTLWVSLELSVSFAYRGSSHLFK